MPERAVRGFDPCHWTPARVRLWLFPFCAVLGHRTTPGDFCRCRYIVEFQIIGRPGQRSVPRPEATS